MIKFSVFCGLLAVVPCAALAEAPEILDVAHERTGAGWRFDVTIAHPDTGWDHYADGWDIVDESGNRLGYRELLHPHVNEQPFTRSLSGVQLPEGTREVFVRARCSVDGWSETLYRVEIGD